MNPEIMTGLVVGIVFLVFIFGLMAISSKGPKSMISLEIEDSTPLHNTLLTNNSHGQQKNKKGRKWRKGCLHDPLHAQARKNFLQRVRRKW